MKAILLKLREKNLRRFLRRSESRRLFEWILTYVGPTILSFDCSFYRNQDYRINVAREKNQIIFDVSLHWVHKELFFTEIPPEERFLQRRTRISLHLLMTKLDILPYDPRPRGWKISKSFLDYLIGDLKEFENDNASELVKSITYGAVVENDMTFYQ